MAAEDPYFLGLALIKLSNLEPDPMRHVRADTVKRLVEDFGHPQIGCINNTRTHAVPALVDPSKLEDALAQANLSLSALSNSEKSSCILSFPENLRPLYGIHRLQAGRKFLRESHSFWSVRLYNQSRVTSEMIK